MKSKVELVTEATDDTNPITMCVVETHMLKEEKITILGYETVSERMKQLIVLK